MNALQNLKLVAAKRTTQISPVMQRRQKVAKRVLEQIALAKAQQDGKTYCWGQDLSSNICSPRCARHGMRLGGSARSGHLPHQSRTDVSKVSGCQWLRWCPSPPW